MTKNRLEGFSDGILAIIITIMVLELPIPHTTNLNDLLHVLPDLLSYLLSFVVLAIFWINHHYLMHTLSHITNKIIWSNFHLLFWLSLIPFATGYMGKNSFHPYAVSFYAIILTLSSIAHNMLIFIVKSCFPQDSALLINLNKQSRKGLLSIGLFAIAIPAAFLHTIISIVLFIVVMILSFIPNRTLEQSASNVNEK